MTSISFVVAATLMGSWAPAAIIGPWPTGATYMWENQPIPGYTSGSVTIVTPPPDGTLNMPAFTGGTKTSWLPYGGTYAEKMTIAQAQGTAGGVPLVHARVYDPGTAGKSGWAVILKDSTGKILDFGIRGFFASQQIVAHQYDGVAWTNAASGTRTRTGNNYYTMDFSPNVDGTLTWIIDAYENGATWNYSSTTTVAYGAITEVYLNVMTPDTTGAATYKWTEFYVPEPATLGLLALGGLSLLRRRQG
jgi:PEP-CTERM motif